MIICITAYLVKMMAKSKHNQAKRQMRVRSAIARMTTKNLAVVYCTTLNGCVMFDTKQKTIIKPERHIVDALSIPYQWSVFMAVLCDSGLDRYMKGATLKTTEKYNHGDLAHVLTDHHMALIDSVNREHIRTIAWLASPNAVEFSESEAAEIFEGFDCWLENFE